MSSRLTSTVIRRLEGLGEHPATDDTPSSTPSMSDDEGEDKIHDAGRGLLGIGGVHKSTWEIPRKVFHSSIGFGTLYLFLLPSAPTLVPLITTTLLSSLIIIIPADILRLLFPSSAFALLYNTLLGFLMRPSELHSVNGVVYYILGVSFSLAYYPLPIAVYSILALSWADTAASTIGRLYGRRTGSLPWARSKSWAGFIGAALVGAGLSWAFFPAGLAGIPRAALAAYAGLTTAAAESIDVSYLDDNLTLPILSGAALWLLTTI